MNEQQQEEVPDFKYEVYPQIVLDVFNSILGEKEPVVNPQVAEVPVIPPPPAPASIEPRVENAVPRDQPTAKSRPKPAQTEQWQRVNRKHRFKFDAVKPKPKPESLWQKKAVAVAPPDIKMRQPEKMQPTLAAKVVKVEASAVGNDYYPEQVVEKAAALQVVINKEVVPASSTDISVAQVESLYHEGVKAADSVDAVSGKSTHSGGFKTNKSQPTTQRKRRALKRKNAVAEPSVADEKNKPLLPEPVVASAQQIEKTKSIFEKCLKGIENCIAFILPYRAQAVTAFLSDDTVALKAIQKGLTKYRAELRRGIALLQDLFATINDDETWKSLEAIQKIAILIDEFSIDYNVQDELESETYFLTGESDLGLATQLFREFRERRKEGSALGNMPTADAKTAVAATPSPLGVAAAQRGLFGDAKRAPMSQTSDKSLQESSAEATELLRQEKENIQFKKIMRTLVGHANAIIALRDQCFTTQVVGNISKLREISSELRVVKVKISTEMDNLGQFFENIDCTVEMNEAFWRVQEIVELAEKFAIEFKESSLEAGVFWPHYLGSGSCVTAKTHLEAFHAWSEHEYAPAASSSTCAYQR